MSEGPGQRWIVVADSPFVPALVGGHREHAGFVDAAVAAGLVAAVVVPHSPDDRPAARYRSGEHEVPVVAIPRDHRTRRLLAPRAPFVVASRPAPPWLVPTVAALAPDATGVVVFSYKVHGLGRVLAEGLGLPAVLRQHNMEAHYHRELARGTRGPRGWLLRWEAERIERDERRLEHAGWLRGIADISDLDAATRRGRTGLPVHHVPPFAAHSVPDVVRRPEPGRVLFLGTLNLATNRDGLRWFVERVWPRVRAGAPGSHLVVVGSGPPRDLLDELAAVPAVEVHADVPEVRPYLESAAVAINPTVSGSGVNIKLVEYLLAAVPTVTTSTAAASLRLEPGPDLGVADEPNGFADALTAMLADPDAAHRAAVDRAETLQHLLSPSRGLRCLETMLA